MSSPDLSAGWPTVVDGASFAVIPGAGSTGLTWAEVAGELSATVLRAPDVLDIRQMRAMAACNPEPMGDPPPTLVLWCGLDSAVPLDAHIERALRCGGVPIPIADPAHVPFLEQPRETLRWIRRAAVLAGCTPGPLGRR
jgi:pimeloyl-ACP methyl ester carboxylesterase